MTFKGAWINEEWVKSFSTVTEFKNGVSTDTKAQWAEIGITDADITAIYNSAKATTPTPPVGGN